MTDEKHLGEKKRRGSAIVVEQPKKETFERDYTKYDFKYSTDSYVYIGKPGLSREVVEEISHLKGEPDWMREFRLQAYEVFMKKPLPLWGADLTKINFDEIVYYARPTDRPARSWDDVPEDIKKTFDRLGIPEAERKFLAGVGAQYDSETVYHNLRKDLEKKGVIFLGMDEGLKEYPEIVKQYFGTVIPKEDNKFAALNSAVWSGGSFVYVPKGVQVDIPLQAYFRINAANMGQFERTLIIAEEGAKVHYIEGCLPGGEQVSLGDRWTNIEHLKPGDLVVASDGRKAKVRAVMVRPYRGDMLTIRPLSPYNAFRLTPEHPVLVVRRADVLKKLRPRNGWLPETDTQTLLTAEPEYVPAGELAIGDFLVFPKVQAEDYNPKYSPELLKLLGYYLAEGSAFIHKTLNMPVVSFTFSSGEAEIVAEVCSLITHVTGKRAYVTELKGRHAVNVTVYSKELMELCITSCGKGAARKRLSDELMALPPEQIEPLLDAYFRGDGNVCDKGNSVMHRAATASETLAQQLQELLARRGIFASIQVREGGDDAINGRKIHRRDQYIVVYTVDKHWSETRKTDTHFLIPIRGIERTPYDGFVFNLDVEGPNSYLVRGFAVHNCTAPVYSKESLHSAVVELIAKPGAHLRYTTLQNWSNDVYNLVTKRSVAYEGATVEWVDANIGCLVGDSKVLLNSDVRPIREVEPGDRVFTLNPKFELEPRRVVDKKYSGHRPVFRLVTENHREIVATANHPFLSLRKEGRGNVISWRRLDELREGDSVAISGQIPDCGKSLKLQIPTVKRTRNQICVPEETSDELMWLLGFYLGDGFCEQARLNIAIVPQDEAFPRVVQAIRGLFGIEPQLYKGRVLRVCSAQLVALLQELGFRGRASEKRVPSWVYRLPQSQRRAFIEGYIAADGHMRRGHKNVSVTSSHRTLLEDIRDLAISCGLNPLKISEWRRVERKPLGKEEKEYRHYFLYFSNWQVPSPVAFVRISRIEPAGKADTWDIEIEGVHNFVANGFIVHNSRVTMKYPSVYLMGKGARADILSVAYAGKGQHQDTGGKVIHAAPYTTSTITSKSVSKDGGRTSYRGLLKVAKGAVHSKSTVLCDALLLDERSRSDTYPYVEIDEDQVTVGHEATVGKVGEDQIFYLMSRGLSEAEAVAMIVLGFMEPFTKTLPMEYAVEFNRLIQLEMEGSVG